MKFHAAVGHMVAPLVVRSAESLFYPDLSSFTHIFLSYMHHKFIPVCSSADALRKIIKLILVLVLDRCAQ